MKEKAGRFACAFVRQDVYRSGFKSATLAAEAQTRLRAQLTGAPKATGNGPFRITLAEAFADYANERLPYLKGGSWRCASD